MKVALACHYSSPLKLSTLRKLPSIISCKKIYQSYKTFNEDKEELIWMFYAKPRQMSQRELYALFHTTSHHHPCHKSSFDWLSLYWAGFSIVFSVKSLSTHLSLFVKTSQSEVLDSGYTVPCIIIVFCDVLPVLRSYILNILYAAVSTHHLLKWNSCEHWSFSLHVLIIFRDVPHN